MTRMTRMMIQLRKFIHITYHLSAIITLAKAQNKNPPLNQQISNLIKMYKINDSVKDKDKNRNRNRENLSMLEDMKNNKKEKMNHNQVKELPIVEKQMKNIQ